MLRLQPDAPENGATGGSVAKCNMLDATLQISNLQRTSRQALRWAQRWVQLLPEPTGKSLSNH